MRCKDATFPLLSCFIRVGHFVTPWTVALQAALSMGLSRQEYCPLLLQEILPSQGSNSCLLRLLQWQADSFYHCANWGAQGFPYLLPFPPIIPLFYPFSLNSTSEIKASQIWNHLVWTSRLNRHRFEIIRVRLVLTQHLPKLQLVTSHPGDSFHRHTMLV